MKIVVTIPAYNEEKTIGTVIKDIKNSLKKIKHETEILVVNDGSSDDTARIAKEAGAVVHSHPKNYGLGEAFRTEIDLALKMKADVIVHTDADGQYRADEIPLLLSPIKNGADLVLGSRFKGKIESMPLTKRIGNILFSILVSYIIKQNISDAQTGFRAFTRKVAQEAKVTSTFTYTQDQIIISSRKKFKIAEVPVTFMKRDGKSRLMKGPLDYGLRGGTNLFRLARDYAPLTLFGSIGTGLIGISAVLAAYLGYRLLTYGAIGKTPTTILTVALFVIGIQIILFGFFADSKRK